jgi:AcrR family transcriptional regulator
MDEFVFDGLSTEARLVLIAALDNFAELGYHGTTTRKIAETVRKSPTAVYTHYRSKHELLFQIILRGHQALFSKIADAANLATNPTDRLTEVARAHAEFHAQFSAVARVSNYELHNLEPEALKVILQIRRQIESTVRHIIASGVATGEFDVVDGNLAATAMLSMGIDVSRWYQASGRLSIDDIGEGYASYVRRMVGIPTRSVKKKATR